jgi:hypothetical protein
MKTIKSAVLLLLCLSAFVTYSQTTEKKLIWDFPIRYGTNAWNSLKTVEDQFNAYNIPEEIAKTVSTEELIKICLNYPEWGLIHVYNDRQTGFAVIVNLFNGFRELLSRKDAPEELLKFYNSIDPLNIDESWTDLQKGLYSFQFTKIELFLAQKIIINKFDKSTIQKLRTSALSVYQKKKQRLDVYSLWDLSPTVNVCLSIIENNYAELVKDQARIAIFRKTLMSEDLKFLDSIVELLIK